MKKTWKVRSALVFLCAALLLVSSFNLCVPAARAEKAGISNEDFLITGLPDFANVSVSISGENQITVTTKGYKEGMEYAWYLVNKNNKEDRFEAYYTPENEHTFIFDEDVNGVYRIKVFERDSEDNRQSAFALYLVEVINGKPIEIVDLFEQKYAEVN